jgi:hypothetical protein
MPNTGMIWLKHSIFDQEPLQFHETIEKQIRFFIPDSRQTYKKRLGDVSAVINLYDGIREIAKSPQGDGLAGDNHNLNRIRRICFSALTIEMLSHGKNKQPSLSLEGLEGFITVCQSATDTGGGYMFLGPIVFAKQSSR